MKKFISESEKIFIKEGLQMGFRSDGRSNYDYRPHEIILNSVPHAYGSATVKYGLEES